MNLEWTKGKAELFLFSGKLVGYLWPHVTWGSPQFIPYFSGVCQCLKMGPHCTRLTLEYDYDSELSSSLKAGVTFDI